MAPTWPQLGLPNPLKTGLKAMSTFNFLKSLFLQPLPHEMLIFGSPRGSQINKKCIQNQLVIPMPFQLRKNTHPTSILASLGSLLGLPRRPQEASKASLKPLLAASWAILVPNSIFWPPWWYPQAQFSYIFNIFLSNF